MSLPGTLAGGLGSAALSCAGSFVQLLIMPSMRLLAIALVSCIMTAVGILQAQSNSPHNLLHGPPVAVDPVDLKEVPEEICGDYVLILRNCGPKDELESFKDHPSPFCKIKKDRVILSAGQTLRTSRIWKVAKNDPSHLCILEFENTDYSWGISITSSYVIVLQRITHSLKMVDALDPPSVFKSTSESASETCSFKLLKTNPVTDKAVGP